MKKVDKIQKRFPAETTLNELTFLNNKKINGELYAYLQENSYPEDGETRVYKKQLPTQPQICEAIGIRSPKTLKRHLQSLIDYGFIIDEGKYYVLPNKEDMFLFLPLSTVQFLSDALTENVIKVYIYLGQRYKYAFDRGVLYSFTLKELGEHTGINVEGNSRGYTVLNNALTCLQNNGFISVADYYEDKSPRKRLTSFSFYYKT